MPLSTSAEELYNPRTGMRLRVLHAPRNGSDMLELEATYAPGGSPPPEHFHPIQNEEFLVLDGELRLRHNGVERQLRAGDELRIGRGERHAMWNESGSETRLVWRTIPGLQTLELFRKLYRLAEAGQTNEDGVPRPMQAAVIAVAYRRELRLTSPPLPVQIAAFGVLAPVGWLLGYRSK